MRFMHESLHVASPLYLGTDAPSISREAGLLQGRDSMNCGCDEILDYTILWTIAFVCKSFSSAEWCYSNIDLRLLEFYMGWKSSITTIS